MHWKLVFIGVWIFWIAWFAFWEFTAGEDAMGGRSVPMLTQVTVRWVPWWITLPLIAWLFVHFAIRYFNPTYLQWLKSR